MTEKMLEKLPKWAKVLFILIVFRILFYSLMLYEYLPKLFKFIKKTKPYSSYIETLYIIYITMNITITFLILLDILVCTLLIKQNNSSKIVGYISSILSFLGCVFLIIAWINSHFQGLFAFHQDQLFVFIILVVSIFVICLFFKHKFGLIHITNKFGKPIKRIKEGMSSTQKNH